MPSGDLKEFVKAVRSGDLDMVRSMAAANPALLGATDPDRFGATPLIHAVGAGERAMVDLLLDLGADINQRSDWWAGSFGVLDSASDELSEHLMARGAMLTPHAAARLGLAERLKDMLDRDPSLVAARGGDGQLPLHFARTPEIAELLLTRGADLEARDIDHASTAAQWLCTARPAAAAYLVKRGASADPFMAAVIGDLPLLESLISAEPAGIQVRVTRERFPAAPPAAGHIYLYTIGQGCGLVHAAVLGDQPGVVRWLAAAGADLSARGGYDDAMPLHLAAWGDKPEVIAALLDAGAELNAPSGPLHQNQPLGWAIVAGSGRAARLLMDRGATIHAHHRAEASAGARGAFRQLRPERPLSAWESIADELARR
jgi:ankyrin repeat protein